MPLDTKTLWGYNDTMSAEQQPKPFKLTKIEPKTLIEKHIPHPDKDGYTVTHIIKESRILGQREIPSKKKQPELNIEAIKVEFIEEMLDRGEVNLAMRMPSMGSQLIDNKVGIFVGLHDEKEVEEKKALYPKTYKGANIAFEYFPPRPIWYPKSK